MCPPPPPISQSSLYSLESTTEENGNQPNNSAAPSLLSSFNFRRISVILMVVVGALFQCYNTSQFGSLVLGDGDASSHDLALLLEAEEAAAVLPTDSDIDVVSSLEDTLLSSTTPSHFDIDNETTLSMRWGLPLLEFCVSCFRSILSLVLLIALRKFFQSTTMTTPEHNNMQHPNTIILQDMWFHFQCRFVAGSIACLLPVTVPTMSVDFGVLVVSTLSQRVFRPMPQLLLDGLPSYILAMTAG